MIAYNIGVFLGAVLQPSTLLVFILALILNESKKSVIVFILIISCIAQWILKAALGSPSLGLWPLIVTFLTGYITISIVYSSKRKRGNKLKEEIPNQEKVSIPRFVKILVNMVNIIIPITIIVLLFFLTPLKDNFQINFLNKLSHKHTGYTESTNENLAELTYKGQRMDNELIQLIHYNNENNHADELDLFPNEVINTSLFECVADTVYDIDCIKDKNEPLFIDDSCLWTFYSYKPIVSKDDYYLINFSEKACGSMHATFNSYYLVKYDGRFFTILDSVLAGKYPQRKIQYFRIDEDGFSFITETCYDAADTCSGMKPDFLEFKFNP